ncbi:MAG: hypothetical protein M3R52_00065 [Acidobacteriota bacterium]|nr:hypothetical protein [Acidobacteriota bacterium]
MAFILGWFAFTGTAGVSPASVAIGAALRETVTTEAEESRLAALNVGGTPAVPVIHRPDYAKVESSDTSSCIREYPGDQNSPARRTALY